MAYPSTPVTFTQVITGENRSDVANLLGTEITAIETALLHPAGQTNAPIRLRQDGNAVEWGPAATGRHSTLGSNGGKSFIGLGCEMYPGLPAGRFSTRGQTGIVLTTDGAGALLIQIVPAANAINQTPLTGFTVSKAGNPHTQNPVVTSVGNGGLVVPSGGYVNFAGASVTTDNYALYSGNATGDFVINGAFNSGLWLWIASVNWLASSVGNKLARWNVGGTVFYADFRPTDTSASVTFGQQVVMLRQMVGGEVFNLQVYQTSGATINASINVKGIRLG